MTPISTPFTFVQMKRGFSFIENNPRKEGHRQIKRFYPTPLWHIEDAYEDWASTMLAQEQKAYA